MQGGSPVHHSLNGFQFIYEAFHYSIGCVQGNSILDGLQVRLDSINERLQLFDWGLSIGFQPRVQVCDLVSHDCCIEGGRSIIDIPEPTECHHFADESLSLCPHLLLADTLVADFGDDHPGISVITTHLSKSFKPGLKRLHLKGWLHVVIK